MGRSYEGKKSRTEKTTKANTQHNWDGSLTFELRHITPLCSRERQNNVLASSVLDILLKALASRAYACPKTSIGQLQALVLDCDGRLTHCN